MHYLDNGSTTQVCEEACEKAIYIMRECFGNPSSLHSFGFSAEKELREAREIVLNSLASEGNLVFTSGGTESNNLAILGAVEQNKHYGKKIVSSSIEHASVMSTMKQLENKGYEVLYLKPNANGEIEKQSIFDAITSDTILVSFMSVNNETGYKLPIDCVSSAIKRANSKAFFHCDNVQGFLKENISPKALGIDLMSISAHKVHASKGVGALYIGKGVHIKPQIFGGTHENSMRAGTENLPGICGFAKAVKAYKKNPEIKNLKKLLIKIVSSFPEVTINSPENSSDYILNFSLGKIKGETMQHFLAEKNIFVSTGSACSSSKPSHVLESLGYDKNRISSSIRVSFSNQNTKDDISALALALKEGFEKIAHI